MPLFKKIIKLPDRVALLNIEVILKTDNCEFYQTFLLFYNLTSDQKPLTFGTLICAIINYGGSRKAGLAPG
jgi:hypothetical protein